jgi:aspartokinase
VGPRGDACAKRAADASDVRGNETIIEKIIELSIRDRFLVLFLAAALTVFSVYAVFNTPVDAIPDLSENQVIVFTDWMGRSPKEVEEQITYPLSRKLQGLAGIKAVRSSSEFNFSMITMIFDETLETVSGVISNIYRLFAENDINIREEMSCWTDVMVVIDEKDMPRAMQALSSLSDE